MNHQSQWSDRISGEAGASELYFVEGGWKRGVNKQEASLISHAAVEELITFMQGSHAHRHSHTNTHRHTHLR